MGIRFVVTVLVLVLVFGGAVGFIVGRQVGAEDAREEYKEMIDLAFPPPPRDLRSLSGVVTKIYGATFNLEVNDPDDYLPHVDGSLRKKETRSVSVDGRTELLVTDYSEGDGGSRELKFSELKEGDTISVTSGENIREKKKFTATRLEVLKY